MVSKQFIQFNIFYQKKNKILLLNSLVISHLHYSSVLLNGISQNLITTLEKQLNWAIKACFNRVKIQPAHDLRIRYKVLPIRYFLHIKAIDYFWKWKFNLLPAFSMLKIPTAKIKMKERTSNLVYTTFTKHEFLRNNLFRRVVPLWNTIPQKIIDNAQSHENMKKN